MDAPWYNEGMNRYEFRIKFDSDRELFVLLVRLSSQRSETVSEYYESISIVFSEPYEFQVCIPSTDIPDQFSALGAGLPKGIKLSEMVFISTGVCLRFEFTEAALLEITPPIYRHWVASVIKAGHFYDLFPRF